MLLLLWGYGSTPASLLFLEFELPNSEILICITHLSPTALQKRHGHSSPLKSSGQKKRGGQKSMLSSETILTSDPSYKGANQRIIYLHTSPQCSNQNIRKKETGWHPAAWIDER